MSHSKYHPREWDIDAACFGHDDEPQMQALIKDLGDVVENYVDPDDEHKVTRPQTVSDLFFPPRIKDVYHLYADRAKDYCFGKDRRHPCPVRKECLIWAILSDEQHGIQGGMSHRERNALVRKAEDAGVPVVEFIEEGNF